MINFIDEKIYALIHSMESLSATKVMILISYLGSAIVLITLAISMYFLYKDKKYPILISINLASVFIINRILKIIFRRDRPNIISPTSEKGFSFPSGHAMIATGFYGLLIYFTYKNVKNKIKRNIIITILTILILSIGISRVYLGVHYATDVIGGYILGIIYLVFFIKYKDKLFTKKNK